MYFEAISVDSMFQQVVGTMQSMKNSGDPRIIRENSRNGEVYRFRTPVTLTYTKPQNRVLQNAARDANPFFHLYEAMWMLSGRDDLESMTRFVKRFSDFSDNGKTLHGAYGYRWRYYFGFDQIEMIIDELSENPGSRRCVLQMWDAGRTLDSLGTPLADEGTGDLYMATHGGKDVPCNLSALFQVEDNRLNMTVFNRSNDIVWGALGANAVHFSFLQEYIALYCGFKLGLYHQISNNLHAYSWNWKPEEWLLEPYDGEYVFRETVPLFEPGVAGGVQFDNELEEVLNNEDALVENRFLSKVFSPMMLCHRHYKNKDYGRAWEATKLIEASDWQIACRMWLTNRREARAKSGQ